MPDIAHRRAPDLPRGIGRSILLCVPMALFTLLLFTPVIRQPGRPAKLAALVTLLFMIALFFLMMRTRETYRWRRVFFVTLGVLFPVGFIWDLISLRGSMCIPIERMICGDTPFCFLAIPMMLVPAALTKTLIFPGSILPTASNPHSMAMMVALWLLRRSFWAKRGAAMGASSAGSRKVLRRLRRKRASVRSTRGGASRRGRFWWPSCSSLRLPLSPLTACGSARSRR